MTCLGARTLDLTRLKPLEQGSGSVPASDVRAVLPLVARAGELATTFSGKGVKGSG